MPIAALPIRVFHQLAQAQTSGHFSPPHPPDGRSFGRWVFTACERKSTRCEGSKQLSADDELGIDLSRTAKTALAGTASNAAGQSGVSISGGVSPSDYGEGEDLQYSNTSSMSQKRGEVRPCPSVL